MKTTLAILSLLAVFAFSSCSSEGVNDDNNVRTSQSSVTDGEKKLIAEFDALITRSIELQQQTTSLDNRDGRAAAEEDYKAVRQEVITFMETNKAEISKMGVEASKEFRTLIAKAPWVRN